MSLPSTTVIGNIQRMETKVLPNGKRITNVSLSCGVKGKDKDGNDKWDNFYVSAAFWEKQSDFVAQYFKEGSVAEIKGDLYTHQYTKTDGSRGQETKFHGFPTISFLPKDKDSGQQNANHGTQGYYSPPPSTQPMSNIPEIDVNEMEIPF